MRNKKEWKVGDRVQWIDYENQSTIYTGAVTALLMKKDERRDWAGHHITEEYVDRVTVKWDDGEEETLDEWDVRHEDSALEREFRKAVPDVHKQIDEKLTLAFKYLSEAEEIADEHGIPFSSGISPLSQSYFPPTFKEKWGEVSKQVMEEATDTFNEYNDFYGWQHSAVC